MFCIIHVCKNSFVVQVVLYLLKLEKFYNSIFDFQDDSARMEHAKLLSLMCSVVVWYSIHCLPTQELKDVCTHVHGVVVNDNISI